jgi:hypothetical protein
MLDNVELILFPLGAIAIIVVVFFEARRRSEQWEAAGERLGLEMNRGGLFGSSGLSGTYRGVDVKVYTVDRGGKNSRRPYTVYEVTPPMALPPGLALTEEGMLASVGKFLGSQDIQVGRDLLDDTFIIKASRPETARAFLRRPGVEGALLELYNRHPNMHLKDGCLRVENKGNDAGFQMEETLDHLVEALEQMSRSDKPSASTTEPVRGQPSDPTPAEGGRFGRRDRSAAEESDRGASAAVPSSDAPEGYW